MEYGEKKKKKRSTRETKIEAEEGPAERLTARDSVP